jgi:hypothetical protein
MTRNGEMSSGSHFDWLEIGALRGTFENDTINMTDYLTVF